MDRSEAEELKSFFDKKVIIEAKADKRVPGGWVCALNRRADGREIYLPTAKETIGMVQSDTIIRKF